MKEDSLKQLRKDMEFCHDKVKTLIKYHISLPTEEAHHKTHPTTGTERVNPQITQKITELVQEGMTIILKKLERHSIILCTNMQFSENPPDADNREYFPV